MSTWDKRYTDRVQLLVEILPMLAREPRFALKAAPAGSIRRWLVTRGRTGERQTLANFPRVLDL